MRTFKKVWAIIVAVACVFVFVCSASAAEPKASGGADLYCIDIWPITQDSSGRLTYRKDLVESFDVDYYTGNIVGTAKKTANLDNLYGVRYFVNWNSPISGSGVSVYITDPTNGIHRANYGLEDVQDVSIKHCYGDNLHIDVSCYGVINTIDISLPNRNNAVPKPVG